MTQEKIKKILDDWGFQSYLRHCKQASKENWGEEITVIENWTNEEVANLIYREFYKTD